MSVPLQCSQHLLKNATVSSRQTSWLFSLYSTGEGVVIATQKQDSIDGFKRKFSSLNHVIFIIIAIVNRGDWL